MDRRAKLTPEQVILIRETYRKGSRPTQAEFATMYQVSLSTICAAFNGRTYKDRPPQARKLKLTDEQADAIHRSYWVNRVKQAVLASEYKVSQAMIHRVVWCKRRKQDIPMTTELVQPTILSNYREMYVNAHGATYTGSDEKLSELIIETPSMPSSAEKDAWVLEAMLSDEDEREG